MVMNDLAILGGPFAPFMRLLLTIDKNATMILHFYGDCISLRLVSTLPFVTLFRVIACNFLIKKSMHVQLL